MQHIVLDVKPVRDDNREVAVAELYKKVAVS